MKTLVDYRVYHMCLLEKVLGVCIGSFIGILMSFIIYKHWVFCVVGGLIGGYIGIKKYNQYLFIKRNKQLLVEFRDCLDFLNASYLVGKNTLHSFQAAAHDCYIQFGEKSYFYKELHYIVSQHKHGQTFETLLFQLTKRMPIEEVNQFVAVFVTVYRQGGDLKQLIDSTKEILTRKINMSLNIQATLFEQKRQITILLFMPYLLLSIVDIFGLSVETSITITVIFMRTIASGLLIIGYLLAKYMITKLEREVW